MERIPALAFVLVLLLTACSEDPQRSPQYMQLEEDAARSRGLVAERDSTINALFSTFNRINDNLRDIRAKQGQLTAPDGGSELGAAVEERIMGDIRSIDDMLAENRDLITKLRSQAKSSAKGMAELERTVADLERTTGDKDKEIETLKEELSSANSSLATLIDMYRDKSQLADMQRNELNTAYYAVGTTKELLASGVLTKEGGFAGIGGSSKLNMEDLPKDLFIQVDILSTHEVPVLARKSKLITSHPSGSYRMEEGTGKLIITDANKFWSVSKYLVIVADRTS